MRRMYLALAAATALMAVLLFGCGGDDGPTKPPPPTEPIGLFSVNGDTLLGTMGSASLNEPLTFKLNDSAGQPISGIWLRFIRMNGDGSLAADSGQTDADGETTALYTFDGDLGYARIVAINAQYGADTVELRASLLTPGPGGQGQYVRFTDVYNDIVNLNGFQEGATDDPRAGVPIWYIEYETSQGVVFMVTDIAGRDPSRIYSDSPVWGIIVNSVFTGTTVDGIGIGSSYNDIIAAFGEPNDIYRDPIVPPALVLSYTDVPPGNMQFYLDTVASGTVDTTTTAFEIHMSEAPQPAPESPAAKRNNEPIVNDRPYRLYKPF